MVWDGNRTREEEWNGKYSPYHQCQQAIEQMRAEDKRMPSISIGYAYYDSAASNIQQVIDEADTMMYKHKK